MIQGPKQKTSLDLLVQQPAETWERRNESRQQKKKVQTKRTQCHLETELEEFILHLFLLIQSSAFHHWNDRQIYSICNALGNTRVCYEEPLACFCLDRPEDNARRRLYQQKQSILPIPGSVEASSIVQVYKNKEISYLNERPQVLLDHRCYPHLSEQWDKTLFQWQIVLR